MSVRLSDAEAWAFLESGHTGILTTLRRDGWPVSLPVWFAVADHSIFVSTPTGAKKISRLRNDDRACFLVEAGEAWIELAAVELPVRGTVLEPGDEADAAAALLDAKYVNFRPPSTRMPSATRTHYSAPTVLRLEPAGPLLSWDNARIRLTAADNKENPHP